MDLKGFLIKGYVPRHEGHPSTLVFIHNNFLQALFLKFSKISDDRLPNDVFRKDQDKRVFFLEKLLHKTYWDKLFEIITGIFRINIPW